MVMCYPLDQYLMQQLRRSADAEGPDVIALALVLRNSGQATKLT